MVYVSQQKKKYSNITNKCGIDNWTKTADNYTTVSHLQSALFTTDIFAANDLSTHYGRISAIFAELEMDIMGSAISSDRV